MAGLPLFGIISSLLSPQLVFVLELVYHAFISAHPLFRLYDYFFLFTALLFSFSYVVIVIVVIISPFFSRAFSYRCCSWCRWIRAAGFLIKWLNGSNKSIISVYSDYLFVIGLFSYGSASFHDIPFTFFITCQCG